MQTSYTALVADIHLSSNHPQIIKLFQNFLQHIRHADALYILGDFFNLWIGDDDPSTWLTPIKQTLLAFSQHTPTYIMHGNRDFLLGKTFAQQTGCILIPDPYVMNLYGTPTLLKHGDDLVLQDQAHQRFRKWTHSQVIQKLFLSLPVALRQRIAYKARHISRQRQHTHPSQSTTNLDLDHTAVVSAMQQAGVQRFIHGHTHQPKTHTFTIHGKAAQRIVLPDWDDEKIGALLCHSDGRLIHAGNGWESSMDASIPVAQVV